jgi:hypothetical protein
MKYYIEDIAKYLGQGYKRNMLNHFDSMVKMQFEIDDFDFNQFCNFYTIIYEFVRLLYFNKKEYIMNYVQEKIIEYFMSFNHLVYFLVVFSFLFVIRCSNMPELCETLFYTKDDKKLFKFNELNNPSEIMFAVYRQILLNTEFINAINNNFNKLFKPLNVKSLCKDVDREYNVNLNNNINIIDNNNFALENFQIPKLQNSVLQEIKEQKRRRIEKKKK